MTSARASITYDSDRLFEEVAYLAYHFHWSLDEILDLEHPLRRRFVEEIARINRRLSEEEMAKEKGCSRESVVKWMEQIRRRLPDELRGKI